MMKPIGKPEKGYDPEQRTPYIARKYEHEGHQVFVTTSIYGHDVKVDNDYNKTAFGLSDYGLFAFMYRHFGKW